MKCQFCGKNIDEVDCSCKMCTICGWAIEAIVPESQKVTVEEKVVPTSPEALK